MESSNRMNSAGTSRRAATGPRMVVGITSPQTGLVMVERLIGLRAAGFDVTLVSAPGELLIQTGRRAGVKTRAIPMKREIALFADTLSLFRLWRMLGRVKPVIAEFSTPKAGLLGSIAGWLRGVPVRVYLLRGLKLEMSLGWKLRILLAAERLAAGCADVVVCNSESLRAKALEFGIAPASKLIVLGEGSSHGVDVERFSPGKSEIRARLGIDKKTPVVGFVGRLTRDKGVPELMEAFEGILKAEPEARLLLVGWFDEAEDALDQAVREKIRRHPRIDCTGMVADTAPYYKAMDMLVLPTWREGFPNVVLEAAATELPVVTTLSTGARDAVIPEVTGFLVPPGYPEALTEAVLKLMRDPRRRVEMGRAGRRWVLEHFADARVVGLAARFYRELLEARSFAGHGAGEVEMAP